MGSTSAVMMMNSQIPRLRVLVASLALRPLARVNFVLRASVRGWWVRDGDGVEMRGKAKDVPFLELLVMRSLLDQVEDLRSCQSNPQMIRLISSLKRSKGRTWLVSCALARGKALGFGADMVESLI